jgi:GYF domain 2
MMFYNINQNGENFGPYTIGQLRSMWRAGQVTGDTLYCEEGFAEWLRLGALAEVLDTPEQPPPLPRRRGFRRLVLITVIASVGFIIILILTAVLSPSGKPAATVHQPIPLQKASVPQTAPVVSHPATPKVASAPETVTEEHAKRINAFADKWDMTVEDVIRWDCVFSRRDLTLGDFDQALAKLEQSREKALGYRPNIPKRNTNGRRLVVGETKFPQNPVLTEDEENAVKMLKIAGY